MESPSTDENLTGYQRRGLAWDPFRSDVLQALESGRHAQMRPLYSGSNHCFLVTLDAHESGRSLAIYKPARGEYPLYDFPNGTLYRREVASWQVSSLLQWDLIPPTVVTRGAYGLGSLQVFIESQETGEIDLRDLQRLALLDVVLNNADRKPDHCLVGDDDKLWGIDHGLTFHAQPKLRTILWHFAGIEIPPDDLEELSELLSALRRCDADGPRQLRRLLSATEWQALIERIQRLVAGRRFPNPRHRSVPYRW